MWMISLICWIDVSNSPGREKRQCSMSGMRKFSLNDVDCCFLFIFLFCELNYEIVPKYIAFNIYAHIYHL